MRSGEPSAPVQITVGEKSYIVVDRKVKQVRLLPGPDGRLGRTMARGEELKDFELRMQQLFDVAQEACAHASNLRRTFQHTE
jgi:hypothetical protein